MKLLRAVTKLARLTIFYFVPVATLNLIGTAAASQTVKPLEGPNNRLGAAGGTATTLADAVVLAVQSNPALGISRYNLRGLSENYVQARAEQRFSAQADLTLGDGQATLLNPNANLSGGVTVSQPIYSGGRTVANIAAAKAATRAGQAAVRLTEGDIILQVITAYSDVRRDERSLAIRRDDLVVLQSILREVDARRIAGELTATDVAQTDAQVRLAESQTTSAEAQLEASRAAYAVVVGRDPGSLAPEPRLPSIPKTVAAAFAAGEALNPEIEQARYTAESSDERVAVAKAGKRPTVSVRSTLSAIGETDPLRITTTRPAVGSQVVLSVPLFEGGRLSSLVRQAEDQDGADHLRIVQARRDLYQAVLDAWNADVAARRNLDTQTVQLKSTRVYLEGMLQEYRLGLRSTFDVLFAEQTLRDTLLALAASEHDVYVAEATLLRRIGTLEASTILDLPAEDADAALNAARHRDHLPWDAIFALLDRIARPTFKPPRTQNTLATITPGPHPVRSPTATGVPATFARSASVPEPVPEPPR